MPAAVCEPQSEQDVLRQLVLSTPGCLAQWDTRDDPQPWTPTALHSYLDDAACDIGARTETRVTLSVPPQHGKSTLKSGYLAAWHIIRWPFEPVILSTYGGDYAAEWGGKARDIVARCGHLNGVRVRPGSDSRKAWNVDIRRGNKWVEVKDGGMRAVGAGGPITGRGASLIIVDDLLKNDEEAFSEVIKEKHWSWYKSTLRSRLRNRPRPGAIVVIATRWAEDDLIGRLKEAERKRAGKRGPRFRHINLTAICDELPDPLGRDLGDPLCPELYNLESLRDIEAENDVYWWSALYQGRPAPLGGGVFKQEYFRYFEWFGGTDPQEKIRVNGKLIDWRREGRVFMTVDLAGAQKKDATDWTVIQVWYQHNGNNDIFLIDQVRAKLSGPEIVADLHRLRRQYRPGQIFIEEVQWQIFLIQQAVEEGLPIDTVKPDKAKGARALGATPWMKNGRVWFCLTADYRTALEHELLNFTLDERHKHDDQVDCLVYACLKAFGHGGSPVIRGAGAAGVRMDGYASN